MYPALQRPRHTSAQTAENVYPHAGDRTITALALCPQSIPPASKRLGLLPPFAMWTAFPSSDYCEGSAPHHVLPRSPRIACFCGRTRCGSHVPVLNPLGWLGFCFTPDGSGERQEGVSRSQIRAYSYLPGRTVKPTRITPHCPAAPSHYRGRSFIKSEASVIIPSP